ncbi:MAG: AMP-binding protein [Bacteroidales bacterium]|nr:AMP-binding protein [Bacteroidales bacterium]MDD3010540.1 AMP-binding protein [Bacteroidales bacterium]MDD3961041.1 AMP-binding protein [Bacteroidales bacterium]HPE86679.1 AMP-binding protein [Bacteroidales bacterium]
MADIEKLTIPEYVFPSFKDFAAHTALSFVDGVGYTYQALGAEVARVQKLLRLYGIDKGDKVAILSMNTPYWGIAFFAITGMGAVAVPLLPDFHQAEVTNILVHSESKAIFVSEALAYKVRGENSVANDILMIRIDDFVPINEVTFPVVRPGIDVVEVLPDDLASIIYTSGTTGRSKGVMLSHKNVVSDAITSGKIHYMNTADRMLSVLPLSHAYENTLGLVLPLSGGASVYYPGKPATASVLLPALKKVQPTAMLTVPLIMEKIFRSNILPTLTKNKMMARVYSIPFFRKVLHRIAGKKLMATFGNKLKFFGVGGSKLDPQVEKFLYEAKFPYAIGYGLTETAPLLAGFGPANQRLYSTGKPGIGVEVKLYDVNPVTGEGEIIARGPNVMKGYYKEPELTRTVIDADGWFHTGDIGLFDKHGVLFIKGRIKNVIIGSTGENIYPEEIESVINSNAFVTESLVLEQNGKLVAMVHLNIDKIKQQYQEMIEKSQEALNEKVEELLKEVHVFVNQRVSKFSKLNLVIYQENPFEKTATQKIKRFLYT